MSKRPFDTNQNKMSRNDRFVQMSQQEMLIEQKKREIQAKLEAKRRQNNQEPKEKDKPTTSESPLPPKEIPVPGTNQFSNDGSFLNQFKQLKEKKKDSKFKTFQKYKDKEREREKEKEKEREEEKQKAKDDNNQDKGQNNDKKATSRGRSPSPLDRHKRHSRFTADQSPNFEPQKITINTSFSKTNTFSSNLLLPSTQVPSVEQNLDQDESLVGPQPSSTAIASVSSDSFPATVNVNFAPTTNAFAPEIINFTSQSQIITIAQPANQNLDPAPHLVTTTVTPPLVPPTSIQPLLQQPVGIIGPPVQEMTISTGQIGTSNLSSTTPTLQEPQPIITQALPPSNQIFATTGAEQIISGPPQVLMSVPPPQIVQQTQLILTPQTQSVLVTTPTSILTTVTLPPPVISPQNLNVTAQNALNLRTSGLATVELTSIPPPNPIQIQNIPQPEPLNTMNIPPPAPLQVQNIPTPSSLQLNEIPNPKPIDLMAIPTPTEGDVADSEFIKNIPPPNKSVPPPNISEVSTSVPPPSMSFLGTQPPQNMGNRLGNQGMRMHNIGPHGGQIQRPQGPPMQVTRPSSHPPPISQTPSSQSSLTRIPSLMSQPVLPPPGMGVNVPPPSLLQLPPTRDVSQPPPNFVSQGPPCMPNSMPNLNVPPPLIGGTSGMPPRGGFKDQIAGGAEFEAMANLARMVAECGPSVEDVVRQKKKRDPDLWFLFHKDSAAYRQYANLVEQYKREKEEAEIKDMEDVKLDPSEIYEPEMALEDDEGEQDIEEEHVEIKQEVKQENDSANTIESASARRERKRKSRWGEQDTSFKPPGVIPVVIPTINTFPPVPGGSAMLTKITQSDPGLVQYVIQTYGSTNLSEEDCKKAEDNYKIHLLYQDMMKKKEEVKKLEMQGRNKYEYDSDEDTEGGTWEHKIRIKEMQATERWATELTRQAEGKHHIGDFLPPEELNRFMEKSNAVKEGRQPNFSDYKEFKIKEDNIGFKMLQKLGWNEGQGLGQNNTGIVEPVNKGTPREHTQGLGLNLGEAMEGEDEYESYRKRMMLAYRFRPNPLNNPRRPYY